MIKVRKLISAHLWPTCSLAAKYCIIIDNVGNPFSSHSAGLHNLLCINVRTQEQAIPVCAVHLLQRQKLCTKLRLRKPEMKYVAMWPALA